MAANNELTRALQLRSRVVDAVAWRRHVPLAHLMRQLSQLVVLRSLLEQTGLGRLLADSDIWREAGVEQVALARKRNGGKW